MKSVLLFFALIFPLFTTSVNASDGILKIKIGVLSPQTGESSAAGIAHDFWIDVALKHNGKIAADNAIIEIDPIYVDTRSRDRDCASAFERLMEQSSEIALVLGPVRSGCVESIQASGSLAVPLISTLSSATFLTRGENRSPWFFRANGNDESRLKELLKYIDNHFGVLKPNNVVIIYDSFRYAQGLKEDLLKLIDAQAPVKSFVIPESDSVSALNSIVASLKDSSMDRFDIFIFGSNQKAKMAIEAIENKFSDDLRPYRFYTVGASQELLEFAPSGLISIGELQFKQNQSAQLEQETIRLTDLARTQDISFYPTTYQAARFVVPEVIRKSVEAQGSDLSEETLDINKIRSSIRDFLENDEFDSLQPPERISFDHGEMITNFIFPIYEVASHLKRIDKPEPVSGWVEFTQPTVRIKFMESPIKFTVIGHQLEDPEVVFYLTRDNKQIDEVVADVENGKATDIFFYNFAFGNYYVGTDGDSYPKTIKVSVFPSSLYLICALAACVAVLLRRQFSGIKWQRRVGIMVEGVLSALVLAFTATYLELSVAQIISSETIYGQGSSFVDGLLYGLVGGWFGPQIIEIITGKFLPRAKD